MTNDRDDLCVSDSVEEFTKEDMRELIADIRGLIQEINALLFDSE